MRLGLRRNFFPSPDHFPRRVPLQPCWPTDCSPRQRPSGIYRTAVEATVELPRGGASAGSRSASPGGSSGVLSLPRAPASARSTGGGKEHQQARRGPTKITQGSQGRSQLLELAETLASGLLETEHAARSLPPHDSI